MTPLIVGGGPAGAAAAITLARADVLPHLIERTSGEHDVVCGGFLGWDALALLGRLGIDTTALGARPITRLRLIAGKRRIEAPLPHAAAGLSRRSLDAALLAAAERAGAEVTRGVTVRSADPQRRRVRLHDDSEIACDALLLATGKHELRGVARPLADRRDSLAVGLRAALPPSPARQAALADTIELHLFDQGYAGLLLQEDGTANLCLSVSQQRLTAAAGPAALLAELANELPTLAERLGPDLPAPISAIAGVPYGWSAGTTTAGLFRLGDQGAVIASLAGDGIAMALAGGIGAAEALLAEGPDAAEAWQAGFARRTARQRRLAEMLRHGAERRLGRAALMALLRLAPGLITPATHLTRTH
ncbi:NAD(P)/FAD-dependent oxidoreductase [Novosphingobium sp. JCM 18896]|uniref:NAD(P)/FAD-dependent oxidoreductase n=1 Tax=Novosphingobium sp. JCM 18896 TaxID=2989731 RepID=UPI0022224693|nr:FAD-dependent oxidoreductase [Novosphingobium sp. JCM 18896]MCW1431015.1 FAD-dependent oxidoreductase [Novosphingobium sp. JCM 18896]